MQVSDKEKTLIATVVLELYPALQRSKIIADMQRTAWLYARYNAHMIMLCLCLVHPLHVLSGLRIDFDYVAGIYKQRRLDFISGFYNDNFVAA